VYRPGLMGHDGLGQKIGVNCGFYGVSARG
jgi:hypothetical protein